MSKSTMRFYEEDKVAVFIDGSNLYAAVKGLGFDIDYVRLLNWLSMTGRLVRASYYTAMREDCEVNILRPLVDWLDYNGYTVITKPSKTFIDPITNREKIKGNMDIEMAVDMMRAAETMDHIILFSGDGDFKSIVKAVQERGARVTVISTIKSNPPMCADELRRQADTFIDMSEIKAEIEKGGKTKIVTVQTGTHFS